MHLEYLDDAGFDIVPLSDLVKLLRAGEPLPDKTAAITFDDGYISIYETAWPMLKEKGWPFTVFINTEPHDQGRSLFMSWEQLREIRSGGTTIANHGVTHPYLLRRQPGQDEATGKVAICAENHGYAVEAQSLREAGEPVAITHVNLNDGTVEGLAHAGLFRKAALRRAFKVATTPPGGPVYLALSSGALEAKNLTIAGPVVGVEQLVAGRPQQRVGTALSQGVVRRCRVRPCGQADAHGAGQPCLDLVRWGGLVIRAIVDRRQGLTVA